MSNKTDELAKASKDLMLKEPFYGLFLIMLNKQWNNKAVPTAGVSKQGINYQLYLNEDFWKSLSPNQHMGLLKHELLHIAFFHITDFDHLTDKEIANIAMDIEINQYIAKDLLPPGPQLPESYPELKLEPKKGTQYYYDKLMQGKKNGNCPNLNAVLAAMAQGQIKVRISAKGGGQMEVQLPDHSTWEEFDNLDEATKKLIKTQTAHILSEVAEQVQKSRGTVPGEMAEILERITKLEPPKFNWRGYLRRFVGGSIKTFTKMSKHKPNFRFLDNPGLKHKQKRKILVAIDTSGSVSTNELVEFLGEINHISRTGTEVIIAQCDAAIKKIGKFDPKQDFEISGRKGTSFHPVTDYYDANWKKFNCLIYLTDGEAPAPDKCRGPVLWVHSSQSNINEDLHGLKIKLN